MKHLKFSVIVMVFSLLLFSCSSDDDNSKEVNLLAQFQGNWAGSYSGGDNGLWTASINAEGVVTGSAESTTLSLTYNLNGTVSETGVFTATVGTATSGATFTGQIEGNNVSGTWINEGTSVGGSWQGTAQ